MRGLLIAVANTLAVLAAATGWTGGSFRFNQVRRYLDRYPLARRIIYLAAGMAGVWVVLAVVLPRVLIAFGVRGSAVGTRRKFRPLVGRMMPSISGRSLSGRKVTIPEDTRGKIAFLAMGFSYDARFDVEDWSQAARERFGHGRDVVVLEMPVIGGAYRFFAPMIEGGMRRGTPAEMRNYVVTVYGSQGHLREALGAAPSGDTWLYLLDRKGEVLFQHGGRFDEQRFEEMAKLVEPLLKKRPTRAKKAA